MIFRVISWKTTFQKDHIEVCLPNNRLLSGLIGMWSSMKITLHYTSPATFNTFTQVIRILKWDTKVLKDFKFPMIFSFCVSMKGNFAELFELQNYPIQFDQTFSINSIWYPQNIVLFASIKWKWENIFLPEILSFIEFVATHFPIQSVAYS